MCVDFTDLNKACPKDSYPLPQIDTLVDSTARHKLLSFMDAFQVIIRSKCAKRIKRELLLSPAKAFFTTR